MSLLTSADIRQAFAEKGCWRVVAMLDEMAKVPRDKIKIPFTIAFIYPSNDAKSIHFDDLLTPGKLIAHKGRRPKTRVQSLSHLRMLLSSIPLEYLQNIDSALEVFDTKQFTA